PAVDERPVATGDHAAVLIPHGLDVAVGEEMPRHVAGLRIGGDGTALVPTAPDDDPAVRHQSELPHEVDGVLVPLREETAPWTGRSERLDERLGRVPGRAALLADLGPDS